MAGAIDLFSGNNSLSGVNLFKVDKSPLEQLDQGLVSMVEQADQVADALINMLRNILDSILGYTGGTLEDLAALFAGLGQGLVGFFSALTGEGLIGSAVDFLTTGLAALDWDEPRLLLEGIFSSLTTLTGITFTGTAQDFYDSLVGKVSDLTGLTIDGGLAALLEAVIEPFSGILSDLADQTGLVFDQGLDQFLVSLQAKVGQLGANDYLVRLLRIFGLLPEADEAPTGISLFAALLHQAGLLGDGEVPADAPGVVLALLANLSGKLTETLDALTDDSLAFLVSLFEYFGLLPEPSDPPQPYNNVLDVLTAMLAQVGGIGVTLQQLLGDLFDVDNAGELLSNLFANLRKLLGIDNPGSIWLQDISDTAELITGFIQQLFGPDLLEWFQTNIFDGKTAIDWFTDTVFGAGKTAIEWFTETVFGPDGVLAWFTEAIFGAGKTAIDWFTETVFGPDGVLAWVLQNFFDGDTIAWFRQQFFGGLTALEWFKQQLLNGLTILEWLATQILGANNTTYLTQLFSNIRLILGLNAGGGLNASSAWFQQGQTLLQLVQALFSQINSAVTGAVTTLLSPLAIGFGGTKLLSLFIEQGNNTIDTWWTAVSNLFSGFNSTAGGTTAVAQNSIWDQIIKAITGQSLAGKKADIRSFLGFSTLIFGTSVPVFNPSSFTAADTLLGRLISDITGSTTLATSAVLKQVFNNVRLIFGLDPQNFAATAFPLATAVSTLVTNIAANATTLAQLMAKLDETLSGYAYQLYTALQSAFGSVPIVGPFLRDSLVQSMEAVKQVSLGYVGAGGNLVPDPGIEYPAFWPDVIQDSPTTGYDRIRVQSTAAAEGTTARSGSHSLQMTAGTTNKFCYFVVDNQGRRLRPRLWTASGSTVGFGRGIVVRPLEQYYVGCYVKNGTVARSGQVTLLATLGNSRTGATTSASGNVNLATAEVDSGGWALVSSTLQIPSTGYDRVEFGMWLQPGLVTSGHQIYLDDLVVKESNLATLIRPGTITTALLGTGANGVSSINLQNGAVGQDQLGASAYPAVGRNINPGQGSGAQLSRRSATNAEGNVGQTKVVAGFYTHIDINGTDVEVLLKDNAVTTGTGQINNLAGIFRVQTAGWYMVEICYRINPTFSLGGRICPLLYRSTNYPAITTTAYKYGSDLMLPSFGFQGQRFVQSTFIVYLPVGGAVQAGFHGEGSAAGLFGQDAVNDSNGNPIPSGTMTYFSISLLNKTYQ